MDCCRITDLHSKQVINTKTGCHIGFVNDVEINTCDGKIVAIIIWGKSGLLGKHDDDIRICWNDIQVIGDEIILVCASESIPHKSRTGKLGIFEGIFR